MMLRMLPYVPNNIKLSFSLCVTETNFFQLVLGVSRPPSTKTDNEETRRRLQHKSTSQYEDIWVEIIKKPGMGLGISVVGRIDGPGVFVSDMVGYLCTLFTRCYKVVAGLGAT
jgi:hypothetical protein